MAEPDFVSRVEHSDPSVYRRDVLRPAHKARLIEYDSAQKTAVISPLGVALVEQTLLLKL